MHTPSVASKEVEEQQPTLISLTCVHDGTHIARQQLQQEMTILLFRY